MVFGLGGTFAQVRMTLLAGKRHTAAFIVGAMAGGLVGAAAALWNAPKSGRDLRTAIANVTDPESAYNTAPHISSRALNTVEHFLAPIVGVELGKTANGSGPVPASPFDAPATESASASETSAQVVRP